MTGKGTPIFNFISVYQSSVWHAYISHNVVYTAVETCRNNKDV